ncbi:MAG: hydroxyacid dehydrogenase [Armatimonadia bacterium]|nr:hydroxyacid dehydrogenase [Armatimonadia bacterium]
MAPDRAGPGYAGGVRALTRDVSCSSESHRPLRSDHRMAGGTTMSEETTSNEQPQADEGVDLSGIEAEAADERIMFFETGPWDEAGLSAPECGLGSPEYRSTTERLQNTPDEQIEDLTIASVFIGSEVDGEQLDRMPDLKLVCTRSTGYDHIDLDACRERDIVACNVPAYAEHTVAEHTFGLMLALSRKILKAYDRTKRSDFSLEGLSGFDLKGKTLGVVGAGAIGLRVIRIGVAMGMMVLAFDVRPQNLLADVMQFEYASLDDVLSKSDVVSLHVPLLPATRHMIDRDALAKMKEGALLINTARGELVDTDALLDALSSGHLGGAGLDVIEGEERIGDEAQMAGSDLSREDLAVAVQRYALLNRDDVVLTPHMAFYSREALHRLMEVTCGNIREFLRGEPRNTVS